MKWKLIALQVALMLVTYNASAGMMSYVIGQNTGRSNAEYEAEQTAKEEGRISCVPQKPQNPDYNLWTCKDAFGNEYKDMVITLKSEIVRLNGTKKAK